jgi:type II secretory pathway pseudopilin PulG
MLQPKASLTVVRRTLCAVRQKHAIRTKGMTLVEVMLAVAVIIVAALGTLCYEYLCVDHIRFARAQLAATRIAQLLIEDWKSSGGSEDYNPEDLHMGFDLPPEPSAGNYMTVIDDLPLYISMPPPVDVATDPLAGITLRRISVIVQWKKDFGNGAVNNDDPGVNLTTYVRRDQ